jgi:hypothetical protein
MIYHMTSNKEDANDLTQDVFAKAYRSLNRFRGTIILLHVDLCNRDEYDFEFSQEAQPQGLRGVSITLIREFRMMRRWSI